MKPSTFARLYVAGYATFTGRLDRKGAGQHRGCRANQDTAAMVYMNSTERHPGAPLTTPRQVDEARITENDKWIAFYDAQYALEKARWAVLRLTGGLTGSIEALP